MATSPGPLRDQRDYKRFNVSGRAMLESTEHHISGEVVTIGSGGMRVKSQMRLLYDAESTIDFSVSFGGGQFLLVGAGKIVRIRPGEIEIEFLQNPMGIRGLLAWLEKEHSPWSSSLQG